MTTEPVAADARKEAIRAELEQTRREFHALLAGLTFADWRRPSANPAWNTKQLMWHLASSVGLTASAVNGARTGKGFNPPGFMIDPINTLVARTGALRATRRSVAAAYDAGHAKMLTALDGIGEDEWSKAATNFGIRRTVEQICHMVRAHWEEHAAAIRARH